MSASSGFVFIADDARLNVNSFHLCRSETLLLLALRGQGCGGHRCEPIRGLCRRAGGRRAGATETNQSLLMSTPILDPSLAADRWSRAKCAASSPDWLRVESGEYAGSGPSPFRPPRPTCRPSRGLSTTSLRASSKGVRQKESPSRLRRGNFDGCRRFSSETATGSSQKWHERFNR
jgi:hypothetical protein